MLLVTHTTYAQQIVFSHYKLDRGLPARQLMQDSRGYLWIGSDGLFRFDGVTAIHFTNDPKIPGSLINNSIKSIAEDTDRTIWIGTLNGISNYNPSTNHFTNYIHKENDTSSLITNADNIVFVDSEGTVWIGNREGISKFNRKQQTFTHYDLTPYQQPGRIRGKFITSIIDDKANAGWLWAASYDGLIHFRKSDGYAVYYYPSNVPNTLNKIFMDSHNRLWICSWGMGVGTFNQQEKKFSFALFEKDLHMGTTDIAFDIKEKPLNAVTSFFYLSTTLGLATFTIDTTTDISHLALQNFLVSDPGNNSIGGLPYDILIDRQNIVWFGTSKDLSYVIPNNQIFINYHMPFGEINTICEDHDENNRTRYWISSWYASGLLSCDSAFSHLVKVNYFDNFIRSIEGTQVNTCVLAGDELWVGTMNGLFMYNKTTKKKAAFFYDSSNTSIPSNRVYALKAGRFKRLWIGTYNNGFVLMDLSTQKLLSLPIALRKETEKQKVAQIFEDSKGFIWLSSNDEILKINEDDLHYTRYKHAENNIKSKAAGETTAFIEDSRHRLWIGNRAGLNMYNEATDNFILFSTADGLTNNNIMSLAVDNSDNLWIATGKGLNRLNTKTFHIRSYYNEDGIEKDDNLNYLFLNSHGNMLIAGSNLITLFTPSALTINTKAPPVYITNVALNNEKRDFIINDSIKKLQFKYDENYFTIDFIALNLVNAAQNKYAYQLEGLDKNFIQAGNTHKATYTNISPGTYIFKVKASNNDDVWTDKAAVIIIEIEPPFWKTIWFIAICIAIVSFIIYAIYRYRIEQLLKVERLRTKISTDLHDDIGSTLSSISILSDIVIRQKNESYADNMLQEIKDNSINLMEKMDDIVWSINPKNDTLENLMLRIKRFAAQLLEAKNIDYVINISADINHLKLPMEKRQHLYLIIKESINNIIKHAECSYVNISAQKPGELLVVAIKDNGKGFDANQSFQGNGLLSIQNRSKLMNAKLGILSVQNEGAGITVTLKIK